MDGDRFDALVRILTTPATRRRFVGRGGAIAVLGGIGPWARRDAVASQPADTCGGGPACTPNANPCLVNRCIDERCQTRVRPDREPCGKDPDQLCQSGVCVRCQPLGSGCGPGSPCCDPAAFCDPHNICRLRFSEPGEACIPGNFDCPYGYACAGGVCSPCSSGTAACTTAPGQATVVTCPWYAQAACCPFDPASGVNGFGYCCAEGVGGCAADPNLPSCPAGEGGGLLTAGLPGAECFAGCLAQNEICGSTADCCAGWCEDDMFTCRLASIDEPCRRDIDCFEGYCGPDDGGGGVCIRNDLGETCRADQDCCFGTICCGGRCIARCSSDVVCRDPGVCDPATGARTAPAAPDFTPCGNGLLCCGGGCADLMRDEAHCAGCGIACPPGLICCGGVCVDIQSDPLHCGDCGVVCPEGGFCAGWNCACPPELPRQCGGRCVDTKRNDQHCGDCFRVCPAGTSCCNGLFCCEGICSVCDYPPLGLHQVICCPWGAPPVDIDGPCSAVCMPPDD